MRWVQAYHKRLVKLRIWEVKQSPQQVMVKQSGIGIGAGLSLITMNLVNTANQAIGLKRQWEDLTRIQNDVKQSGFSLANAQGKLENATINLGKAQAGGGKASALDLKIAQSELAIAIDKYGKHSIQAAKAQSALNKLQSKGGADLDKVKKAQNNLERAQRGVTSATINQKEAQVNLQRATQDFYLSTIPTGIGVIGSFASVMQVAQKSSFSLGGSLAKLAVPFAAISGVALAIKTNFLGFRDFLTNLGSDIGKAVPAFKPLLNVLEAVGSVLGLTPKKLSLNKAIAELQKGFQPIVDTFKGIVDNIMKGNWEGAFGVIKTAAMNFWNALKHDVPFFGEIETLVNKIKNGNWQGALMQIWVAATSVWNTIKKNIPFFGDVEKLVIAISQGKWGDAFTAIKDAIRDSGLPTAIEMLFGKDWITNVTTRIQSIPAILTAAAGLAKRAADKGDWKGVGAAIGGGIASGMKASGGQDVIDFITNLGIGPASILQAMKDPKQKKMWENIGTEIGKQLTAVSQNVLDPFVASLFDINTWTTAFDKIVGGAKNLGGIATKFFDAIFPKDKAGKRPDILKTAGDLASGLVTEFGNWFSTNLPKTSRIITQLINSVKTAISDNVEKIRKLGDMLGRIIWNAMVDFLRSGNSPLLFGNIMGNAIPKRAAGFHGIATGPMLVGERSAERVDITTMSDMVNRRSDKSSNNRDIIHTHVYLNGKHIAEAVASEIAVDQAVYR